VADDDVRSGDWAGVRSVLVLVVLPVAVGVLTTQLPDWWPVWAAAAVLAVVIAAYRTHDAPMAALRTSPIGYLATGSLTAGFLITLPVAAQHEHTPLLILLPAMLLWGSILTSLTPTLTAWKGLGLAHLAACEATALLGVELLREGDRLFGVALLLVGMALLLVGVAAFRGGDRLFGGALLLVGMALLLVGAAGMSVGVTELLDSQAFGDGTRQPLPRLSWQQVRRWAVIAREPQTPSQPSAPPTQDQSADTPVAEPGPPD